MYAELEFWRKWCCLDIFTSIIFQSVSPHRAPFESRDARPLGLAYTTVLAVFGLVVLTLDKRYLVNMVRIKQYYGAPRTEHWRYYVLYVLILY